MNENRENLKLSQHFRGWFEKTTNIQWPESGSLSEFYGICLLGIMVGLLIALVVFVLALSHVI